MSNLEISKKYLEAFSRHKTDEARSYLADDYNFQGPIEQHTNADAFIESFGQLVPLITGYEYDGFFEKGDHVFAYYRFLTSIPGLESTRTAEWFTFRDGKIASSWMSFDTVKWRPFIEQQMAKQ